MTTDALIATIVPLLPNCDICRMQGEEGLAYADAKMSFGPWANVCEKHFKQDACRLGLGSGQELLTPETAREEYAKADAERKVLILRTLRRCGYNKVAQELHLGLQPGELS
jgi:hypothetical protein